MATMSTTDAAEQKAHIRARVRATRAARVAADPTGQVRREISEALCEQVMSELGRRELLSPGNTVAIYVATESEPGTRTLRHSLNAAGITVLIPRVDGTDLQWITDDGDVALIASAWGIDEPAQSPYSLGTEALCASTAIIVPALAIDERGFRVGQGGGFYDRAIAVCQNDSGHTPLFIGLIHDDEVMDVVPREAHDARMDVIATDKRIITTAE